MRALLVALGCTAILCGCSVGQPLPPAIEGERPSMTASSAASHAPQSTATRGSAELAVPFSPQAPFAVWDPLHEEACEEMSLIMVHHFLAGTSLSREDAEGELLALIAWQERQGLPHDIDVATLARVAREYYGYRTETLYGEAVTTQAIRTALDAGTPVIVPAQGQLLGNPYFSGEGPPYHMLVITGYDGDAFITNDPGTRRGEGYRYDSSVLLNAIHDWNGAKETAIDAPRAMLLVTR